MSLAREEIVKQLCKILGEDQVITDEQVLRESSIPFMIEDFLIANLISSCRKIISSQYCQNFHIYYN